LFSSVYFPFIIFLLSVNQLADIYKLSLSRERLNQVAVAIEHEAEIAYGQHKSRDRITQQIATRNDRGYVAVLIS
jgi:hypothetical protein